MGTFSKTFGVCLAQQGALLNPLQDETKAYIAGLTTPLLTPVISVIDTYVKELKAATGGTIAEAFDFLHLLNVPTAEASVRNIARDDFHITPVGSPAFSPYYGYLGESGKYLNPDYNLATDKIVVSQNSSSMLFYSTTEKTAGTNFDMGAHSESTPFFLLQLRYTGDKAYVELSNNIGAGIANNTSKGCFIVSRQSATSYKLYRDGVELGTETVNSEALPNNNVMILAATRNNNTVSQYTNKEVAVAGIGRGFSPTEVAAIAAATQKYVTNLPKSVWDYSFTTRHIATQRGSKVLEFDDAGTLYYSIDGGTNYTTLVTDPTISIITFAHIFENGNVIFADHTKVYLSTDNLATYAETTVLGIDGNTFVPGATLNNFRDTGSCLVNVNGTEIKVWGNYVINGGATINVWYTKDSGVTIKSIWKSGVTNSPSAPVSVRHIHNVNYNQDTDRWYITTGDNTTQNNLIEGVINYANDTAVWTVIGSGETSYKLTGMFFKDGYAFWASDGSTNKGIWKCLYADLGTPANHTKIFASSNPVVGLVRNGKGCVGVMTDSVRKIIFSEDMINFYYIDIVGGPTLNPVFGCYYIIKPKNTAGYFAMDIFSDTETIDNFTAGPSLLLKI